MTTLPDHRLHSFRARRRDRDTLAVCAAAVALLALGATTARSQEPTGAAARPTGREIAGVPALNYNSDEGFGYGALLAVYDYGTRGADPYRYTLQPTVFFTTGGRRDLTMFFDAPSALGARWRLTAFAGDEKQSASPYYGTGNESRYDETLESEPNSRYYRFGRRQSRGTADAQYRLGASPLRLLGGVGAARTSVDPTADGGTTLLAQELGGRAAADGWSNYVRFGLVWDSRDREVGPTRGRWAEVLVQRFDRSVGSDWDFTRSTLTWREYVSLSRRLVLAGRVLAQQVSGDAPFYELAFVQSSFKQQEGLGGLGTVRGLPKNRYVGKGLVVLNGELRWRAADVRLLRKPAYVVLSGFGDAGRVWSGAIRASEVTQDLHVGYGGGVRLGLGPNFLVALDVGHSAEATAPIYLGLGYMF
jgi:outer membrane protein assembly factor BamA